MLVHPWRRLSGWFQDAIFRVLVQNAGWLLGGKVAAVGMGLAATVIKTRALGVELFGLLSLILAYVALVERLSTFQPWIALIKYGAEALEHKRYDQFAGQVRLAVLLDLVGAGAGTVIAVVGAHLLAGWLNWTQETSHMAAVFSACILFRVSGAPIGVLRLLDRFDLLTVQNVVASLLALIGALIVFVAGGGIWGFLIAAMLSTALSGLLLWVFAIMALQKRGVQLRGSARITQWKPFLRFSMWTYFSSTLDIPVKHLDSIIVAAVISLEATGIYQVIKQTVSLLGMLADPIYQAVYPQFAAMIAARETKGAAKYAAKIGSLLLGVISPVALLLIVTSRFWLGAVFGDEFASGWFPMSVFLFLKVFSVAAIVIHPLFTAMGYVKQTSFILLLANTIYLGFAWLLGRSWGLTGLAVAYGLQFSTVVVSKAVYMAKHWSHQT